jgi:WD40 repeat protein
VVTSVAISSDDGTIVSGSHDGTIDIWSLSDGELLHTLGDRPGWMISVAITPDNHKIVSSFFVPSTETKQATVQEILIWQASP